MMAPKSCLISLHKHYIAETVNSTDKQYYCARCRQHQDCSQSNQHKKTFRKTAKLWSASLSANSTGVTANNVTVRLCL